MMYRYVLYRCTKYLVRYYKRNSIMRSNCIATIESTSGTYECVVVSALNDYNYSSVYEYDLRLKPWCFGALRDG